MLVHKGGKINNLGGKCRDVRPTKLQSQNIFKESTGGGGRGGEGWGGQDDGERRIKVYVKIQKKKTYMSPNAPKRPFGHLDVIVGKQCKYVKIMLYLFSK